MIIVGYQGIGKSTLAKNSNKYIDLESGNFWIGDERQDDWYKIYCKIATDLSRQGYTVFVSSHYVVRKGLRQYSRTEEVKCCFPDISLRDKWIKKLEDRYHNSKLEKDYRAWQHAKDFYVRDIQNLSTDSFESICIKSMDYDLKELIENKEGDNSIKLSTDGQLESLKEPIPVFVICARRNYGKSLIQMRDFINRNSIYGLNPNCVGGFWGDRFKLYFGIERATGKYKTTCRWKDGDTTIIRSDESLARIPGIPVEYTVGWCYVKKKFKTTPQFKKYVDSHSFVKDNITYFEGGVRVNWAQAFANNRTKKYDIYDTAALAITAKHYGSIKNIMDYCDNEWWGSDQAMKEKKEWQK